MRARRPSLAVLAAAVPLACLAASLAAPATASAAERRVPAPYRWQGKAKVRIRGAGLDVNAAAAPATCGAYFVQDGAMAGKRFKAGDGLAFQVELPEGTFQLNADDAATGVRELRGRSAAGAVFNRKGGGSFAPEPRPGDRVEVGADYRTAKVRLRMKKLFRPDTLEVSVDFDCR